MRYDYLIVGAGLFGCVFANEAKRSGKRCLVVEKRGHIAGNAYTEWIDGVCVHRYGAHIFHTDSRRVWEYVNRYAEFNGYVHSPMAKYQGRLYNLPFNMNTFRALWGVETPDEAKAVLAAQRAACGRAKPGSLEERALGMVGRDVYEALVKGYTEKQWGRTAGELPGAILSRLPVRFTYDNRYFDDRYQGVPVKGYTALCEALLDGVDVRLHTDFLADEKALSACAEHVLYTGMPDALFGYRFGELSCRSLRFETKTLRGVENYQGCAVINHTGADAPYTRVIEHKHFAFGSQPDTVVTWEYPQKWTRGAEPYYPVNDEGSERLYSRYRSLAMERGDLTLGGRLGEYRYLDMDDVILHALELADARLGNRGAI